MDCTSDKLKSGILAIIAFFTITSVFSQENKDFTLFDAATYKAYNEQRWKDVLDTSNIAIKQGIDYFYLRMRAGIAASELKKHRKAVFHFDKALDFNSGDVTAKNYLIKSSISSGFFHRAAWIDTSISGKPKFITAIFPEMGVNNQNNFNELKTKYNQPVSDRNLFYEKELSGPFQYYSLSFIHEISPKWQLNQNFSYLKMEKFKQVQYDNETLINPSHIILENTFFTKQFSWYVSPRYFPASDKEITFYLHNFLVNSNLTTYKVDGVVMPPQPPPGSLPPSPLNYIVTAQSSTYRFLEISAGLNFKKHHTYYSRDWEASLYKGDGIFRLQAGYTFSLYPFAKPVFSSATSVFGMLGGESGFVVKQSFRFIPVKFLDIEAYGIMGNMAYFSDKNGLIIYNLPDPMRLKTGINILFHPFSKLSIMTGYTFSQSSTQVYWNDFAGKSNNGEIKFTKSVESYLYNNHLIFGGILWAF